MVLYDKRKSKAENRTTLDIEYEKSKEECTFKPKVNEYKVRKVEEGVIGPEKSKVMSS